MQIKANKRNRIKRKDSITFAAVCTFHTYNCISLHYAVTELEKMSNYHQVLYSGTISGIINRHHLDTNTEITFNVLNGWEAHGEECNYYKNY